MSNEQRFAVRRHLYGKVFQVGMAQADGFQRFRVKPVDSAALHIFKPFGAGHVQRIALRAERHFVQPLSQFTFERLYDGNGVFLGDRRGYPRGRGGAPLKTAEMTRANTGMVYFIIEILNKINKPVVALRRYYVVPA